MAKRKTPARPTVADTVDEADNSPVQGNDATATKAWKAWQDTRAHLKEWRTEAAECYDMVAGRQWTDQEIASLQEQMRPVVTFNRTGVVLDSVAGYEINSRQDVAYLPREVADTGPVQVESEAAKYYRQHCDAEDEESDAFYDMLASGLGVVEHRMDYDDDPEGMLKVERVDPLEMGYDPAASKRNLSDRRWDIRGKWWDKDVAKAAFPDHDFDSAQNIAGDNEDDTNERPPVVRELAAFYKDGGTGEQEDRRKNKVFILEYTWFENEAFVTYLDPLTGQKVDASTAEFRKLTGKLEALAAQVGQPFTPPKSVKRTRKVFKRAFVHGHDTIEEGDAPCPRKFHYQFMTGKRDRNKNTWFGLVRLMKDPQRWANKFMSQTMHMINANVKGGILADEGAFMRPQEVEQKLGKPGWIIEKRQGFEAQFVPPTPIPNSTFNLMQFAISSVRDTTGVNVEMLGMADRDQPGVLEHSRKQSAMAILAPFFDSMRRYRKEAGRLTLYFIKTYMSDERKIRIVSEGKAQFVPVTAEPGFDQFDVVVDQAPSSPNAKQAVFGMLMQVLPALMKSGVPIPPDLLDYIPDLPAELAEKWKAMLSNGPTPEQQAAAQLAMARQKAEIDKLGADTMAQEAKATESIAKVIPLLQQVLVGLGALSAAIPGGPEVSAPGQTMLVPGASLPQTPSPPIGGPIQ